MNLILWYTLTCIDLLFSFIVLHKLTNLFSETIYSIAQNKSISMSIDSINPVENWLNKGNIIVSQLYSWSQFTHLFMRPTVAQIQSLLHLLWLSQLKYNSWLFSFFFFLDQTTHWIRKDVWVYWCSASQPQDKLQLNWWTFYESNEVFIITWNISISKCNAQGFEPPTEAHVNLIWENTFQICLNVPDLRIILVINIKKSIERNTIRKCFQFFVPHCNMI